MKNMHWIGILIVSSFFIGNSFSQPFVRHYPNCADGSRIFPTPDGNFIVFVIQPDQSEGDDGHVRLLKINIHGDTLWTRDYPSIWLGPGFGAYDGIVCADGGFAGVATYGAEFFRTDVNGNLRWSHVTYDTLHFNIPNCIECMPDGGFIIGGQMRFGDTYSQGYARTDSLGNPVSFRTTASDFVPIEMIRLRDDHYLMMCTNGNIMKVAPNLDTIWTRHFARTPHNTLFGLCEDLNRNLYLSGMWDTSSTPCVGHTKLISLDSSGSFRWERLLPFWTASCGKLPILTDDNHIMMIGGCTHTNQPAAAMLMVKYTLDGDTVWTHIDSTLHCMEHGLQLPDGGFMMVSSNTDIVRTNPDGTLKTPELRLTIPNQFSLANYPNPFNNTTRIRFSLPVAAPTRLELFNSVGERVVTLANGTYSAGEHSVSVDGSSLTSGVYFCRLNSGAHSERIKIVYEK